jgi:hypothetical protein
MRDVAATNFALEQRKDVLWIEKFIDRRRGRLGNLRGTKQDW